MNLPHKNKCHQSLIDVLPTPLRSIIDLQKEIPRIAKQKDMISIIEQTIKKVVTEHSLILGDCRNIKTIMPESVHLILTSPPYWTLKKYPDRNGQLASISKYDSFLNELDKVWEICYESLVPGGRLICVVGDVCLSRRKNSGRHTVIPLHASIQERCQRIGFDNLSPIIWNKIANAVYEVNNGTGFLGKPYEPNAVIKNDIEYILMERKPGGYRRPSNAARILSVIPVESQRIWFQQIWTGITGASTNKHPAPFPLTLAERLIRMFSFVGDIIFDPFVGTGTTMIAAARWGRSSIGIEVEPSYFEIANKRLREESDVLFSNINISHRCEARV